ncbi:unnamed protein product [Chilo suppressalis]|uniref:Sulfotransferase domain-containing protein n=1 Tax=Chilo suppressalis TaxID=168631 RepID=A0ABN8B9D2_CHISP|nr:hypothetical protein evm_002017 [Chilo suppressalis]CAH0406344.1 unnamed protein product [Chilo suppressalis]
MNGNIKAYYPFEIKKLDKEEYAEVFKHFNGDTGTIEDFIRVGPKGYWFISGFAEEAPKIYNMELRPDDVWVISYPKSGTTWMQELVWQVANDFDYAKAELIPLMQRFPFLEFALFFNGEKAQTVLGRNEKDKAFLDAMSKSFDQVSSMPSPRFIKSHLPLSLLPPALLDSCRVVHVARDPRDVAVSYYHHYHFFGYMGYTGNFKHFWNLFIENKLDWTPYFENVKESWRMRDHPNMLFLFYEDALRDLPSTVKRVAAFLGKAVTEEQVSRLCDHLAFDNFKKNKSVNFEAIKEISVVNKDGSFIRKGKAGDWRGYFDEEMMQQAQRWMEHNLRDTDLRFPTVE